MKKFFMSLGIVILLGVGTVCATEVTILSGSASWGNSLFYTFITNRVGAVVVEAQWKPKSGARYVLNLKHLTNPSDPLSYDVLCQVYEPLDGSGSGQTVGDYHCDVAAGPIGTWTAEFRPVSGGRTAVTMTVTGETD